MIKVVFIDKQLQQVYALKVEEAKIANASMVSFRGKFYTYKGAYSNSDWGKPDEPRFMVEFLESEGPVYLG